MSETVIVHRCFTSIKSVNKDFVLHRTPYSLSRYNIVVCIKSTKILISKCVNIDFRLLFLDNASFSPDTHILFTDCFGHTLTLLICGNEALTVGERLCVSCRKIRKEILKYQNSQDLVIKNTFPDVCIYIKSCFNEQDVPRSFFAVNGPLYNDHHPILNNQHFWFLQQRKLLYSEQTCV
jgi:hypothetical protein